MLDNLLINWFKLWSFQRRTWLTNLLNIADLELLHPEFQEKRESKDYTIEDITDEYLKNPERFDIPKDFGKEDRFCMCGNLKLHESDFCGECI